MALPEGNASFNYLQRSSAMCLTVCLLNMKGGVGKTTLAVNLAWHAFRHAKKRVLLIDFDPQFNASQYTMDFEAYETHVRNNGTIADLLIESPELNLKSKPKTKSPKKCIARIEDGGGTNGKKRYLDILPSQLELAHVVKNPAQMEYKLEKLLAPIRPEYDYIFIDCAPTDSVLTTMALTASNFILTPVRPDRFSILGFGNLIKTVRYFRENSNDANNVQELGIVFTQVRDSSTVEKQCMNSVRSAAKANKAYVFNGMLGFSNTFVRAVQDQTPAFETKYARDDLKANMTSIVEEMEARIAGLRRDKKEK